MELHVMSWVPIRKHASEITFMLVYAVHERLNNNLFHHVFFLNDGTNITFRLKIILIQPKMNLYIAVLVRYLFAAQFGKHTKSRFGMQETNIEVLGTFTSMFVDELYAFRFSFF